MAEPMREDRRAGRGQFCIWIEMADGSERRVSEEFGDKGEAITAAGKLVEADKFRQLFRVIVYDDAGFFAHKFER